jgi:hypothetical protein
MVLKYREVKPGQVIKAGTPYRIKRADGVGIVAQSEEDVTVPSTDDRYFVEDL